MAAVAASLAGPKGLCSHGPAGRVTPGNRQPTMPGGSAFAAHESREYTDMQQDDSHDAITMTAYANPITVAAYRHMIATGTTVMQDKFSMQQTQDSDDDYDVVTDYAYDHDGNDDDHTEDSGEARMVAYSPTAETVARDIGYSTSSRNGTPANGNHLEICLSFPQKNGN